MKAKKIILLSSKQLFGSKINHVNYIIKVTFHSWIIFNAKIINSTNLICSYGVSYSLVVLQIFTLKTGLVYESCIIYCTTIAFAVHMDK